MVSPFHGRRMSPAEYLAMERASDVKHELVDGVVREVGEPVLVGPAPARELFLHALLVSRLLQVMGPALRLREVDVVGGGVRLVDGAAGGRGLCRIWWLLGRRGLMRGSGICC